MRFWHGTRFSADLPHFNVGHRGAGSAKFVVGDALGSSVLPPAGLARSRLAGRVPLKIVYLLVRRVLSLAVLIFRKDRAKDAELLMLRHENAVLRRNAGRVRYEPAVDEPVA